MSEAVLKTDLEPEDLDILNLTIASPPKEAEENTTLFPKITGKIREVIFNYRHSPKIRKSASLDDEEPIPANRSILNFTGTVKLHGTHADLVVYHDDTFRIQSRNKLSLDIRQDNCGSAAYLLPLKYKILSVRDQFLKRYQKLNPGVQIDKKQPVIIAGEWIGPGVQKKVALASLPKKCFVILSANINGKWLPDSGYEDIHVEEVGIYNISRGGIFHATLDVNAPEAFIKRTEELTLGVEKECPFSKSFNISGIGEGIVWKAEHPFGEDAQFWLKTKGPQHMHTHVDKLQEKAGKENLDAATKAREFADATVTEMRLKQAWDYLWEMGIARDKKAAKEVVKWMCKDIEVEEKMAIQEMGIDLPLLRSAIAASSRYWYFKKAGLL